MWKRILRWAAPVIIVGSLGLPAAQAQTTADEFGQTKAPAKEYTVAFLSTLVILVIICAPSRKN